MSSPSLAFAAASALLSGMEQPGSALSSLPEKNLPRSDGDCYSEGVANPEPVSHETCADQKGYHHRHHNSQGHPVVRWHGLWCLDDRPSEDCSAIADLLLAQPSREPAFQLVRFDAVVHVAHCVAWLLGSEAVARNHEGCQER